MRTVLALVSTLLAVLTVSPSLAAPNSDWATCAKAVGDDAIAACDRLLKSGGKKGAELAIVYVNRCLALNGKKDSDRALADCSEAVRLDARSARAHSGRCWALTDKREYDRALLACDEAIRLDAEYAPGFNNRCSVWNSKNDLDRAIADCSEAIRLNPKSSNSFGIRCDVLRKKKEPDRALADCEEALKLAPKVAGHYVRRANVLRDKGEYDRALADESEAIRLDPKYVAAHNNRCVTWYFKKDLDRAIKDCNEALHLDPKYAFAHYNRGNAWREKGAYDRAIDDYSEAIRLDPKYFSAYTNRGLLYEKLGKNDQALADFRAVLAANPQTASAADRVRRIERRLAAVDEPKPSAANTPARTSNPAPTPPVSFPAPTPQPPQPTTPTAAPKPQAAPAPAETRVALVIGNSSYSNAGSLPNARGDAEKIAATLRRVGFSTVTLSLDLPREKISEALKSFAALADRADWAVVYYAGHGIEFGGANYLIPTDAKIASDRDISFETVSLDQVMIAVEGAQKLRLVILDACRDNPFAKTMRRTMPTRSLGRGLTRVEPEGATLVVFAAKDGQVANDGDAGGNSPFATAFAKYIETPGLEINFLFRKVRDDVLTATGRRQEPFVYGSLPAAEFYFRRP
jgi:tetratricopeptide (TPR) repeat protein